LVKGTFRAQDYSLGDAISVNNAVGFGKVRSRADYEALQRAGSALTASAPFAALSRASNGGSRE